MLNKRRHDVDAIRAIALFLLIAYHLGISFMSWAPFVFFIPNIKSIDSLWIPMAMINTWRIPILFLISGIAFRYSFENRSPLQLIKERLKVLGIPLLFILPPYFGKEKEREKLILGQTPFIYGF